MKGWFGVLQEDGTNAYLWFSDRIPVNIMSLLVKIDL